MLEKIDEELKGLFFKAILPAIVTMLAKMSIMLRDHKLTWFRAISIAVCGLSSAYLFGPLVIKIFSIEVVPVVISGIVMTSERLGSYLIYKFRVEPLIVDLLQKIINTIKK
jgi:hypothetical protein